MQFIVSKHLPNPVLHPSDYLEWRAKMQAAEAVVAAAHA
jgi:hypothetical protein